VGEETRFCSLAGLERQLQIFVQLPFASFDHLALKARLDELGANPQLA
jgi:hypothetical protein